MADMRTLYVEIPASLHRQLRVRAAAEDRLLRDVVAAALAAYLGAAGAKSPKQPPATTGPGSPGYVRPKDDEDVDVSDELPPAKDGEDPFEEVIEKVGE